MRELSRLLQAGAELIKMVLQATGPGAQQLLVVSASGAVGREVGTERGGVVFTRRRGRGCKISRGC